MSGELPIKRDLDCIYLRIQEADGSWGARCLTDIPWSVIEEKWAGRSAEYVMGAVKHLHDRLRAVGDQLDIFCGEDPHDR